MEQVTVAEFVNAGKTGDVDTIQKGIDQGLDPNSGDGWGSTVLDVASMYNHVNVCRLLIRGGASVNISAFYWAWRFGYAEVEKVLEEAGAV